MIMKLLCASGSMKPWPSIVSLPANLHATAIHSRLNHPNIVSLLGAGTTSKSVRFVVLERLDGGTLSQMLGYDTRIRDRRRRFWRKKHMSYLDILKCARSIADAMAHCHEYAIPGFMVLHRDLKPDNIGK
jgi:serine/threonine protein kinase